MSKISVVVLAADVTGAEIVGWLSGQDYNLAYVGTHHSNPGWRNNEIRRHAPFQALGARPSLEQMIEIKETAGIPNIVYGLGRTEAFRRAGGFVEWSEKPFSQDVLVAFAIIAQGGLVLSPHSLFRKRSTGRKYSHEGEAEYIEGYRRIIREFIPFQTEPLLAAVDRKVIG